MTKYLATAAVALALGFGSTQAKADNVCAYESQGLSPPAWFTVWLCGNGSTSAYASCTEYNNSSFPTFGQDRGDFMAAFMSHKNANFGTSNGYCYWLYMDNN